MEQVEEFTFTTGADISEYLLFLVNLFNTLQYRQNFEAVFEHLYFPQRFNQEFNSKRPGNFAKKRVKHPSPDSTMQR